MFFVIFVGTATCKELTSDSLIHVIYFAVLNSLLYLCVAEMRCYVNVGFASSPYIITHSNESTNQMQQFLRFITCRLNTAQHVLGIFMPYIRSSTTAVAASGFTVRTWW